MYIKIALMKYNPITKKLFTDDNQFLKKMNCPLNIDWVKLEYFSSSSKLCNGCNKQIYDTNTFSDLQLVEIFNANPDSCVKVDLKSIMLTRHDE